MWQNTFDSLSMSSLTPDSNCICQSRQKCAIKYRNMDTWAAGSEFANSISFPSLSEPDSLNKKRKHDIVNNKGITFYIKETGIYPLQMDIKCFLIFRD